MNGKCFICKEEKKLLTHHISYFPEKTIKICYSCHGKISQRVDGYEKYSPKKDEYKKFYPELNLNYIKKTFTMPEETIKQLEELAKKNQRNKSNMLVYMIENYESWIKL